MAKQEESRTFVMRLVLATAFPGSTLPDWMNWELLFSKAMCRQDLNGLKKWPHSIRWRRILQEACLSLNRIIGYIVQLKLPEGCITKGQKALTFQEWRSL